MGYFREDANLEDFDQGHAEAIAALKACATQDVKAYFLFAAHDVNADEWTVGLYYSCPTGHVDTFEEILRKAVAEL